MTARGYFFMFFTLGVGFAFQQFPLMDVMNWFVPEWVLLVFIFWQLQAPNVINFTWIWPIGLLLDAQQSTPLGTSVLGFSVALYALQVMYQRMRALNVAQQTVVVFLLVCCYQLVTYWAMVAIGGSYKPLYLWVPALVSVLVWPWMYLLLLSTYQKVR